jgi:hypothetical protein
VQRCIALIDRLCSLLSPASPADPEIEAIRQRHDVSVAKPQWSALSHLNGVTYQDVAQVADKQEREIGTLLLAYDRMRKERDRWRAHYGEQARVDREVIASADCERDDYKVRLDNVCERWRQDRDTMLRELGPLLALRAALDDDALAKEGALFPADDWPCGDCSIGKCTRADGAIDAYRAKLREAGK